jgi:hypothetical protein
MKRTFLFVVVLLLSCEKKSELRLTKNGIFISPVNFKIDYYKIIDWKVGPLKRQRVSKGVELKVKLPQLKNDDLKALGEKKSFDSWLLRITRKSSRRKETLGYLKIPLHHKKKTNQRSQGFAGQTRAVFPRVYYVDAALSTRLEKKPCPGLGHSLEITKIHIDKDDNHELINPSLANEKKVNARVEIFKPFPSNFNGGKSLNGQYWVQLALYNSKTKQVLSNFVRASNDLIISRESYKAIKGCQYQDTPVRKIEDNDGIKKFKWKGQ